jgi:cell division septal protein FtsQ
MLQKGNGFGPGRLTRKNPIDNRRRSKNALRRSPKVVPQFDVDGKKKKEKKKRRDLKRRRVFSVFWFVEMSCVVVVVVVYLSCLKSPRKKQKK